MNSDIYKSTENLVIKIRELQGRLDLLSNQLRRIVNDANKKYDKDVNKQTSKYWIFVTYLNSLVRIRLLLEQNFRDYIESMELLAVTRYLFELTVWLKLMQKDETYGCVYYRELLITQSKFYTDLQNHLEREIIFFREISVQEKELLNKQLSDALKITDSELQKQELLQLGSNVEKEIDNQAARRFSLYGEEAQHNGYAYQAHIIETKILPDVKKNILNLSSEISEFDNNAPENVKNLIKTIGKRWEWKKQAREVAMENEYDFIYTYTSKLLHATPASILTDQKNLDLTEMKIFLNYIHIRLVDIIEMTEDLLLQSAQTLEEDL